MPKNENPVVWSSKRGDLRGKNQEFVRTVSIPPGRQVAYLHRESSGRSGKAVTLVKNLALSTDDMKSLAKKLKQACGTGGTVKDGMIEIQGEQREQIAQVLQGLGYKVKVAGG